MFARYASAVSSGTLMTFALLYVMQLLISLQPGAATEPRTRMVLDIFKVRPDTTVQKKDPEIKKEQLTKIIDTPDRPMQPTGTETINVPRVPEARPPTDSGIVLGAPSDNSLINMVRVSPVYPPRAEKMGLEGHVIVQFDVDATGRVINAIAIESSHSVFERDAVRAAERFRYKARVVDGVPVATLGIRNLFTFTLDD